MRITILQFSNGAFCANRNVTATGGSWPIASITKVSFDATQIRRLLAATEINEPIGADRPKGARDGFLVERPVHFENRRLPTSSTKPAFGDSGRPRVETGDRVNIAGERLHSRVANWCSRPIAVLRLTAANGRNAANANSPKSASPFERTMANQSPFAVPHSHFS
jgi:hypothetical protein